MTPQDNQETMRFALRAALSVGRQRKCRQQAFHILEAPIPAHRFSNAYQGPTGLASTSHVPQLPIEERHARHLCLTSPALESLEFDHLSLNARGWPFHHFDVAQSPDGYSDPEARLDAQLYRDILDLH